VNRKKNIPKMNKTHSNH